MYRLFEAASGGKPGSAARIGARCAGRRQREELSMSGETPRNIDDSKGRLKEAAGDLTGDKDLEREGQVDQATGAAKEKLDEATDQAEETADSLKEKVEDLADKIKDRIKDR